MTTGPEGDEGFTLVELLISIAILTIIMGAITAALVTFLKNGTYASQRDDHSGGAVVLSTYLNRDFASADSTVSVGGTPCTGPGASAFTLRWTEWVATPAHPTPAPASAAWRASYVVTTDPAPPVGAGTRFQLHRTLCRPDGTSDTSLVLRNLKAPAAEQAVLVSPGPASTACPAGRIEVTLPTYSDDSAVQRYAYTGCLRGRNR